MPTTEHRLVERSEELSALEDVLDATRSGTGSTLLFCGQAGVGKSALVLHAQELARERGFTVLHSCPTPVSETLAHGVVRDWVGPLAQQVPPGAKPFDGPAQGLAGALSASGPEHQSWTLNTLDYALTWLFENLCESGPLLLVVDDVQWADGGSLQVLDLLSARLSRSPVVLLLGRRTGETTLRPDLLERITARARVLSPQPLSVIGVDQIREQLPVATATAGVSSAEVHRLTGGLPFLVRELLRSGPAPAGAPPRSVVESVRDRLGRLGEPTLEIARTVALLGDEATFDALGELCGLTVAELADPLEVLTDADITTLGLWRAWPSHPLVREAILASMSPSERSAQHRRAADHLSRLDRSRQVIASHLVHTLPDEDLSVVDLLRTAAVESLESGAPQVAAAQLLRAVGETTPDNTDPQLLRQAAAAHMRAGLTGQAFELWDRALERMSPEERALCLADVGDARMRLGQRAAGRSTYQRAGSLLQEHGYDATSPVLRMVLARMAASGAVSHAARPHLDEAIRRAVDQPPEADGHADRLLLALTSNTLALEGRDRRLAENLARRATADGRLLAEESCDGTGFYMAAAAFIWTDSFEEGLAALDEAVAQSTACGSQLGFATASYCRGFLHYRRGNLHRAVTDLEAALAVRERGWHEYVEPALAILTLAYVDLGQVDEARALEPELRELSGGHDLESAYAHLALGVLAATRGEHDAAIADYDTAASITGERAGNPAFMEWRELATSSLMQLGRRTDARRYAQEAVDRARAWGSPRAVGFALSVLGQCAPQAESVRLWREAVSLLEGCGAVDQLARTRIALGAQLIRTPSTRREGAELLEEAMIYARETGVPALAQRATKVLLQHGMKVSEQVSAPLRLLTRGERRVVELAAAGHTNRKIAQELFVTVKAVEWHLSNAYRKLAISSRGQLPGALSGQPDPGLEDASSSAR